MTGIDKVYDYSDGLLDPLFLKQNNAGALIYLPKPDFTDPTRPVQARSQVHTLTLSYSQWLIASAVPWATIFEDLEAGWMTKGYHYGVMVGGWCSYMYQQLHVPADRFCYFADDADHADTAAQDKVLDTLNGIRDSFGEERLGYYGFRRTLNLVHSIGLAEQYWLTGSPPSSDTVAADTLALYQHNYEQPTVGGIVVDVSTIYNPFWYTNQFPAVNGEIVMARIIATAGRPWLYTDGFNARPLHNQDEAHALESALGVGVVQVSASEYNLILAGANRVPTGDVD